MKVVKETKFKNLKRRRRKNNKFRKHEFNADDKTTNKNSELTNNSKIEKIKVDLTEIITIQKLKIKYIID